MFDTFDAVLADLTQRLTHAAKNRRSPMHTPVVATSDVDARVMVLREFDADAWTLRFHTDARAPKVTTIATDPRMVVLLYDAPSKIQIRVRGIGEVLTDDPVTDSAWASSANFARRCYLGEGPGCISDTPSSGLPPEFEGVEPTAEEVEPGRPNFAVLRITLQELDWFYLAHTGHVRAQFTRSAEEGDIGWQGRWVTP